MFKVGFFQNVIDIILNELKINIILRLMSRLYQGQQGSEGFHGSWKKMQQPEKTLRKKYFKKWWIYAA